jgi:hypothetical protein
MAMLGSERMTVTQLQDKFGPGGFGPNGFDYSWSRVKPNKAWSTDMVEQVQVATAWLSLCGRRKTVNRKVSSYTLKHECERWAGRYVSNGALLMAAHSLGFAINQISYGPNGWINISQVGRPKRQRF